MVTRKTQKPNRFALNTYVLYAWDYPSLCNLTSGYCRNFFHSPQLGSCLYSYASDPSFGRVCLRSSSLTKVLLTFYQHLSSVSKSEIFCDTVHTARQPSALAGSLRTSEPVSILLWLSRRIGYLSSRF